MTSPIRNLDVDLTDDLLALAGKEDSSPHHRGQPLPDSRSSSLSPPQDVEHTLASILNDITPSTSPDRSLVDSTVRDKKPQCHSSVCIQCNERLPISWFASFVNASKSLRKVQKCFVCRGHQYSRGASTLMLAQKFLPKYLKDSIKPQLGYSYILLNDGSDIKCNFTEEDFTRVQAGLVAMLTAKLRRVDKSMSAEEIRNKLRECLEQSDDISFAQSKDCAFKKLDSNRDPSVHNADASSTASCTNEPTSQKREHSHEIDTASTSEDDPTDSTQPPEAKRRRSTTPWDTTAIVDDAIFKFDHLHEVLATPSNLAAAKTFDGAFAELTSNIAILADAASNLLSIAEGEDVHRGKESKNCLLTSLCQIIGVLELVKEEKTIRIMVDRLGLCKWAQHAEKMSQLMDQSKILLERLE